MKDLHGVYPILPTPFTSNGELDETSLKRLIDYVGECGVHGVSILGFLGEAHKLSSEERDRVVKTVVAQRKSGVNVFVGIRAFGAAGAIEQAQRARDLGADGLFVAPIQTGSEAAQFEFYRQVVESAGLPALVHDFPESFGVTLSSDLIVRLTREVELLVGIKLEEKPVLPKLSRILEGAPESRVFGGLGGMYCLEELGRGASGIMTGFAFPAILVDIYNRFSSGDRAGAAEVFDRYASLIRYEFQPLIGLAFRKYFYKKRGVFDSEFIRPPGMKLDSQSQSELDALTGRLEISL